MAKHEEHYPAEWFEEAMGRERAWLSEAHELIRKLQGDVAALTVPKDDSASFEMMESLFKKVCDQLLDGEADNASQSLMDAFKVSESRMESVIERTANRVLAEFEEAFLFRQLIKRIEQAIPQMNPESDAYEPDSIGEIKSLMRGYVDNDRLPPSTALEKATRRLYGATFKGIDGVARVAHPEVRDGLSRIRFCLSKDGRFIIG